jgi:hypothetical protein
LGVGIGQLERAGLGCQAKKSTVLPRSSKKTSRPSVSVRRQAWATGRTDLKNPIEDLTIRVTCDHNNFEVRINLLGCFKNLITGSVRQFQVQKHEIESLLPEAFNGLFRRSDHQSTEANFLQECPKQILQARIVIDH